MTPSAAAQAVAAAAARLRDRVVHTPLLDAPWLAADGPAEARLKLENVQHTGSFKYRGACNALACLPPERRRHGVVAASSGNHGLALARAAAALGAAATIYVPSTTPFEKRRAIAAAGAQVVVHGDDCVLAEAQARAVAAATGRAYVSPYNDPDVLAGQGTIAVELLAQWPEVDTVYVAMGGGGLVAGMAAYAKSVRPSIEFVACSPLASPAMAACVRAGRIVDVACADTFSDSTAGGVEPGAITFDLCRALVDRWIEVDERAIAVAVADALECSHLLVEGAAGVALAACRQDAAARGRRAAVVVCGANVPLARLRAMLALAGR